MGGCGSKKLRPPITKEEEDEDPVTSQRLNEFFGATLDEDVKGGRPDGFPETESSQSFSEGEPSPKAETAVPDGSGLLVCHSYAELMGECLAPAGTNVRLSHGALSEEATRHQRGELEEAAKLIRSMGAPGSDAAIMASCDKDGCRYELSINWDGAFVACATQRITALPLSMIEVCALVREPDLIPLPRWPGLPRLETVSIVHEFSPNDIVYHIGIEPWGPFPGVDSIAVAVAFVRPDGAVVGFARSPPDPNCKVHRGWTVLPHQKRRKRMELDGCAWVITPRTDGRVDVTIYIKTRIPIPHWLVPPALVRWVTPKVFRRVLPMLTCEKTKAPFRQRVLDDTRGFYAVLKQQLGMGGGDVHDRAAPSTGVEQYSLGVHPAPTRQALLQSEMQRDFVDAIKAYDWALAERLATTAEQKQDLRDSILRVSALELLTTRGEKQKALALAISEAEVQKIHAFVPKAAGAAVGTPRGFFGAEAKVPPAKQPPPRGVRTVGMATAAVVRA
jgi:hypothetical protein